MVHHLNDLQLQDAADRIKELNKKHGFELTQMDRLRSFLLQGKEPESERGKEGPPLAQDPLSMIPAFAKLKRLTPDLNPFQTNRSYRLTNRMVYAVVHLELIFCSTSSGRDQLGFTEGDFRDPPHGSLLRPFTEGKLDLRTTKASPLPRDLVKAMSGGSYRGLWVTLGRMFDLIKEYSNSSYDYGPLLVWLREKLEIERHEPDLIMSILNGAMMCQVTRCNNIVCEVIRRSGTAFLSREHFWYHMKQGPSDLGDDFEIMPTPEVLQDHFDRTNEILERISKRANMRSAWATI